MKCFFNHGTQIRERDDQGRMVLRCEDCNAITPVLASPVLRGPKAEPDQVLGTPLAKAKRITRQNTIEFPRQSER